jgi:hypothetical protein
MNYSDMPAHEFASVPTGQILDEVRTARARLATALARPSDEIEPAEVAARVRDFEAARAGLLRRHDPRRIGR